MYSIIVRDDSLSKKIADKIRKSIDVIDDENPKVVISIGGDGTILRAIHKYQDIIDEINQFNVFLTIGAISRSILGR